MLPHSCQSQTSKKSKKPDHELKYRFEEHIHKTYGNDATVLENIESFWWENLSEKMRAAAILLGFDEESWDENENSPAYERIMEKSEFSEDEIDAIETLHLYRDFPQVAW